MINVPSVGQLYTLPSPPPSLPVLCQPALDTWSCSTADRSLEPCQGPSAPGTDKGEGCRCQDPPHQAETLCGDLYPGSKVWPRKGMVGVYIPMRDPGHVPATAGRLSESTAVNLPAPAQPGVQGHPRDSKAILFIKVTRVRAGDMGLRFKRSGGWGRRIRSEGSLVYRARPF